MAPNKSPKTFTMILILLKFELIWTTVSFQFAEVYFRWKGTIIRPILSREEPFVADAFKDKFFEVIAKIVRLGVSLHLLFWKVAIH